MARKPHFLVDGHCVLDTHAKNLLVVADCLDEGSNEQTEEQAERMARKIARLLNIDSLKRYTYRALNRGEKTRVTDR